MESKTQNIVNATKSEKEVGTISSVLNGYMRTTSVMHAEMSKTIRSMLESFQPKIEMVSLKVDGDNNSLSDCSFQSSTEQTNAYSVEQE